MKRILLIGQQQSSSGLLRYTADALRNKGCEVIPIDAQTLFWPKLWPTLKGFSFHKDTWYRRRWEANLYSPEAWDRNTRINGRLLDRIRRPGDILLHMAKEHFPHPSYASLPYYVFIQSCLTVELRGGVAPWIPKPEDQPPFMERERRLFQSARKVFTGARYVQEPLRQVYGVPPERLSLGGGGADDFFLEHMPDSPRARPVFNMIMVGWDFGMKGGHDAVAALHLARQTLPSLTLTLVGPPLDATPDAPGLIKIGPLRDRARLLDLYQKADLFVLPSLYDTFGFVFCEAMSQGLPCIGTDFNAMPELIGEGINGYLVPRRNPEALAAKIVQFYSNPSNLPRMSAESLRRVQTEFTWSHVADRLLAGMEESL